MSKKSLENSLMDLCNFLKVTSMTIFHFRIKFLQFILKKSFKNLMYAIFQRKNSNFLCVLFTTNFIFSKF